MTDAALDFSVEGMTLPPRKPRSPFGIGGSEIALAMLSFGNGDATTAPRWMRERAAMSKRHGVPFWIAEKVGLTAKKQDDTMRRGIAREPELLSAFIERLEEDRWQHEAERDIDPSTIQWFGALPSEWPPFKDRTSPLAVRPDAWARTWAGALVAISLKCARYGFAKPAWWNGITEVPWYYAMQQHGEHAVCRFTKSLVVVGCGWNRDDDDPRSDGPILVLPVQRDEEREETARSVARRAWALVESRLVSRA